MAELTPEETAEVEQMLAELHAYGYQDVAEHKRLKPGTRIRHKGHQWFEALTDGTGVVVAITEKPDSAWSRSWGMADVELVALWDKPTLSLYSRLSQVAQYHVCVIEGADDA